VSGFTISADFPTTAGAFDTTINGSFDVFVTKLNASGSSPLTYSTYLGGSDQDLGFGIALDGPGNAYVVGETLSFNFPLANAFDTLTDSSDAFVTKLNPNGSAPLIYSTYLGGNSQDLAHSVAVDAAGNAYVSGVTYSSDFPTTPGAFDTTFNGAGDIFVVQIADIPDPPTIVLAPVVSINPVNEQHCVTATVTGSATGDPLAGIPVVFSVMGANARGQSAVLTNANGEATFCYTGTNAGVDTITAFADSDSDGDQDAGEPSGVATKTYTEMVPSAATVTITPTVATNSVGLEHCVIATVRTLIAGPVANVTVRFTVTGANPRGTTATTTNTNGEAQFCYTGSNAGVDTIRAFVDSNNDGDQDVGEPFGIATKTYVVSTPLCEVSITNGGWIIAANGDRASFGGNARSDENGDTDGQEQYQDHGPAQPLKMHSINVRGMSH
jgi:hypothetical protein